MLVTLLSGVFDPAPESLVVPWLYLGLLTAAATLSTLVALGATHLAAQQRVLEVLRDL
jgi:putative ABC transport system permease protein